MMLALTWWGWSGLIVAVVIILGAWARRSWRATVRLELVDYLEREALELTITRVHADRLIFTVPGGGDGVLHLQRFYSAMADCPTAQTAEAEAARRSVFATLRQTLREAAAGLVLDPAWDRPRVRPRLLTDAALAAIRRLPEAGALPAWPSGVPGLSVVVVLDCEASVAYLTDAHLLELGLAHDQALALAKANLACTFARDTVRQAVTNGKSISVVKSCDSYDAARLLPVPDYLEAGESIAALIPDRDTLVLIAPPADGDWTWHRTLARNAEGDPLYTEPLVVTSAGIATAA